jgi:hypothetical protein
MSQILKKIWVEGPNGETLVREYYVNEPELNPYRKPVSENEKGELVGGTPLELRNRKAKRQMARKIRGDELGYTWTMGYNNCVGRYTQGGKYPRFSGSSLNRNRQLSMNFDENKKDIQAGQRDTFKMALKVAGKFSESGLRWPEELRNYIMLRNSETERKFRLWFSTTQGGDADPLPMHVHVLSARSRGKIKDKATAFFRASAGDRVFCTLTFIAAVDDRTGVAILNKFLTALRKKFPKLLYLWVAERQENNVEFPGNIHFHMILNKRLPVGQWNAMWVLQQYNEGLVGKNEYGEQVDKAEILRLYDLDVKEKYCGARGRNGKKISRLQKVFNPFDVKRVRSIGGLSMYLTKYITKQKKNDPFGCSVWHCSRRVSQLFTRTTVGPSAFAYMKSPANFRVDKETGECWAAREDRQAFYVIIYANNKTAPLKYLKEMEQINRWISAGETVDRMPEIDDDDYRKYFCKN